MRVMVEYDNILYIGTYYIVHYAFITNIYSYFLIFSEGQSLRSYSIKEKTMKFR